jgi:UDP-2-acetamido-3-amino-2,3-dideoxy-glucuronate N-acetyltransferase
VRIHQSSFVDDGAEVGEGTSIWHFCHVMSGARIGKNCRLGQNVFVASDALVGDNVKIQNSVSVYSGVELEDGVFCGPSCVFTNVGNPRSEIPRRDSYEKTLVRRGATLGANSTIVCGITIGRFSFIAAGAVVIRDVPDYALVAGVPARRLGWMSRHGHRLRADEQGQLVCPQSGWRYVEEGNRLRCVEGHEDIGTEDILAVS